MTLRETFAAVALVAAAALVPANLTAQIAPAAGLLDFSATELQRIQRHGPWPAGKASDSGNRLDRNAQAVALGQQLFLDRRLSADGSMSCASCHDPALAFADGRRKGMGRVELERNTPSLWNAGHERWFGWDGAADSIWSQALRALVNPLEMASSADHVARTIAADAQLACRWQQLFGHNATQDPQTTMVNAAKAMGAFTASLVSAPTPFDDFREALATGDAARAQRYPLTAQRGLRLFVGRGQCQVCHSGPMFSNGEFGDTGRPFFVAPGQVDPGRHGGIQALLASAYNLLSPWADVSNDSASVKTRHVALQHRNFGEFKVPSLRNVADTAPYMHDGQLASLEAVVDHYSSLNLERLHADGEQILQPLRLSTAESADLVAFLRSLSAPNARRWQPETVASCTAPRQ